MITLTVLIHAHYEKELCYLLRKLGNLLSSEEIDCKVVVMATEGISDEFFSTLASDYQNVYRYHGQGRNFGSIIYAANNGYLDSQLTLHLHTKRSPHIPFRIGRFWLMILARGLVRPEPRMVPLALKVLESDGFYFPKTAWVFGRKSRVLPDGQKLFEFPELVPYSAQESKQLDFPAGGMFLAQTGLLLDWARAVSSARPIFRPHNAIHGEVEHFLERHLGLFFQQRL